MLSQTVSEDRLKYYAKTVMMVEPTKFFYNQETACDNEFMNDVDDDNMTEEATPTNEMSFGVDNIAVKEHQALRQKIEDSGVSVMCYQQQADDLPDSVFPNNWVSVHHYPELMEQKVVWVYPMKAKNRQREVNPNIVSDLMGPEGHCIDFTGYTDFNKSLEGTGVLIFDPLNQKIYAGLSQRCEKDVLEHFCENLNAVSTHPWKLVTFWATTPSGTPIYHTNVMMSILSDHAAICLESIRDVEERERVVKELTSPELNRFPREIIDLSLEEVFQMGGNILWVVNRENEPCVIMSSTAYNGFTDENRKTLEGTYKIIHSDVSTIEKVGGGSARCMVAEVF